MNKHKMEELKLQEIKIKNPILEVAQKLGLNPRGYTGSTRAVKCYSHPDQNPSLVIMPDVGRFECKACGVKGDQIDLIRGVKGCSFQEAILWLDHTVCFESQDKKTKPEEYLVACRGITETTAKRFNLRVEPYSGVSKEYIGEWCVAIPLSTGEKYRFLEVTSKGRFIQKPGTNACLFKTDPAKDMVILCEGELDAMLLWQETGLPSWSGSAGAGTFKEEWLPDFQGIDKIILAYDNDEEGNLGAKQAAEKLGIERCYQIQVPSDKGKDWTDYFNSGKTKDDFFRLISNAIPLRSNLVKEESLSEKLERELLNPDLRYFSGFKSLDRSIEGFRSGRTYIVSGLKKSGKSSFLMNIVNHMLNQNIKIGYVNTELTFLSFFSRLAAIHNNIEVKVAEQNENLYRDWVDKYANNFFYLEKIEIIDDHSSMLEKIEEKFLEWVKRGVEVFVLDNLTTIATESTGNQRGWEILSKSLNRLIDFAKRNRIVLFIVLHTKDSLVFTETPEGIKNLVDKNDLNMIFDKSVTVNRRPTSADLYGGGAAKSQVSGGILLLWRPYQDFPKQEWQKATMLILEDFRDGAKITEFKLEFQREKLSFTESKPRILIGDSLDDTSKIENIDEYLTQLKMELEDKTHDSD